MLENTLWQGINLSFYPIPLTGWRSLSLSAKWLCSPLFHPCFPPILHHHGHESENLTPRWRGGRTAERDGGRTEEKRWGTVGEMSWSISQRNLRRSGLSFASFPPDTPSLKKEGSHIKQEGRGEVAEWHQCAQVRRAARYVIWYNSNGRVEPETPLHKPLNKLSTNPKIVQSLLNISGTQQLRGGWWRRGGGDKKASLSSLVALRKTRHTSAVMWTTQ